jgi:hypothetical protein
MAVYVNKLRTRYGSLTLCHLLADTLPELHFMAERLGLGPELFQQDPIPHYDLSLARREQAIAAGASVIDRQGLAEVMTIFQPIKTE